MKRGLIFGWIAWLYDILGDWKSRPIVEWFGD